jgi:hypothetical protein
LDVVESKRLIKRVCEKFKRTVSAIYENEVGFYEAGVV